MEPVLPKATQLPWRPVPGEELALGKAVARDATDPLCSLISLESTAEKYCQIWSSDTARPLSPQSLSMSLKS